jgi:5'-nucleotidase
MSHVPQNNEIETFTGQYVDVSNPDPSTISLEAIAHGLSGEGRYNNQCRRFYSVAEHAVAVSKRLQRLGADRMTQLIGLHHDDPEAYLKDIPRPIKSLLEPQYGELTRRMEDAISTALGLPLSDPLLHATVKEVDSWALIIEAYWLLPSRGENWIGTDSDWSQGLSADITTEFDPAAADWRPACYSPEMAEQQFLARHYELVSIAHPEELRAAPRGRVVNLGRHGMLTDVYVGELDTVVFDKPYDYEREEVFA